MSNFQNATVIGDISSSLGFKLPDLVRKEKPVSSIEMKPSTSIELTSHYICINCIKGYFKNMCSMDSVFFCEITSKLLLNEYVEKIP